jgi:hypothetical protein
MKQNWSRRELEAFGEPLGDSVTQRKLGGGYICGGGGKGGGGGGTPPPQQSTAYQTNVPEYAKPYVTNMLEATQKQLFNMDGSEITGFKPYTPYSTDVNQYFAGFSPMQQQAMQATGQLQVPGQYGQATQMTGLAGLGSLGLAGQAAGTGQQFAQQAQDPNAIQGYMSPFMQNVVDYQKSQALRDFNIGRPMRARQAVGAGAFGGSRQAIMEAEAERGLMSQLQGIAATGSQKAFEDAQRQQQFGAQLGLQGLQAGLGGLGQFGQMAGQLGQLGGQQLGAQKDIIGLQSQMGGQQQALEQAKINQAIQDYATQQQYPLMQLGMMSNMLRGLPLQATTTQTYQAAPAPITQGLGLLAGAAGAKQAGLFAEGGTIKGLASGGVTGYANRGMVQANPSSEVVRGVRAKLEMMPAEQLQRVAQTSPSEEIRAMALQILREQQIREQAEAQAQQSIAQDQRGLPTPVTERAGLPAAPAGSMDMLNAASGGIVAFAGPDGSQVDLDEDETNRLQKEFADRQRYTEFAKKQREAAGIGAPKAALGEFYTKEQAALADAEKQARGYDLLQFGVNLAAQPGSLGYAAAKAGQSTLPGVISRQEGLRGRRGEIAKGLAEVKEGERLMALGDIEGGNKMFSQAEDRLSKERIAGAKGPGNMIAYANNYLAEKVAAGDTRDAAVIKREGMDQYMYLYGQAGPRAATAATVATGNIGDKIVDANAAIDKNYNIKLALAKKADKPRIEAERDEEKRKAERIIREGGTYKVPSASTITGSGSANKSDSNKPKVINLDKI